MPTSPRHAGRRRLALLSAGTLGLATLVTPLVTGVSLAPASAASTGLVISEAYGGGGNSGATLTHDFIELHNPTTSAINVDGMSVQYRSSGGTGAGAVTELSGSVPAGGYYLVQQAQGNAGTAALPTPDATGTTAMSGSAFTVWLAEGATALTPPTGSVTTLPGVVDLLGVNSNTWEGTAKASGVSNATSSSRVAPDADQNGTEFATGAPTPQNTDGQPDPDPEPEPEPTAATIPEIQGTGFTSPLVGDEVVTEGVVTAAPRFLYGFYLQTPGTGSAAERTASDAVFVYYPFGAGDVTVEPGDHVRVTGEVTEYAGATQVESSQAQVEELATPAEPVVPYAGAWPASDAEKEALEGMLFDASGERFTVTNTFSTNTFGEVGLALGDTPLIQPTEVADAQDAAAIAAVEADNAARAIVLDDGSGTNYTSSGRGDLTPPYVSTTAPVRVGAAASFTEPVILTEGGSPSSPTYRFQPTVSVTGPDYEATSPAVFQNTRTAAPEPVGGDVQVASFNVLNYFTTLGDADDDNVGDNGCTAFDDRDGDGNNVRGGCDQRGAWDPQDFARQQEKIVSAINTLEADVVGLMEIENSAALGEQADEATEALVAALNADAGFEKWAANPSSAELPAASEQDVITNAIIYRPDVVERVGEARALGDQSASGQAFGNAREPNGQVFAPVGGGTEFLFVVNHFKSKGSGADDGTGQGRANPDRVAQATALRDWVPGVAAETGTEAVMLVGDFNAYAMEDPLQVLYEAGYTNTEKRAEAPEYSYSFSGLSGSLDHVLANDAAMAAFTGVDIWNINSGESVAMEYSRFNNHGTDFHQPGPFRSSDHDPVTVGFDLVPDAPEKAPSTVVLDVRPQEPKAGKGNLTFKVEVSSEAGVPTGEVTVVAGGQEVRGVLDEKGTVVLHLRNPFTETGEYPVTVTYGGDELVAAGEQTEMLSVRR